MVYRSSFYVRGTQQHHWFVSTCTRFSPTTPPAPLLLTRVHKHVGLAYMLIPTHYRGSRTSWTQLRWVSAHTTIFFVVAVARKRIPSTPPSPLGGIRTGRTPETKPLPEISHPYTTIEKSYKQHKKHLAAHSVKREPMPEKNTPICHPKKPHANT